MKLYKYYDIDVDGLARYKKAIQIIKDDLELRVLSDKELAFISNRYEKELINGVKGEGCNLAMVDTLLPSVKAENLPKGKSAFVIEIGGTNVRSASMSVGKDESYVLKDYTKAALDSVEFENEKSFFDSILRMTKIPKRRPDAIGIIWSFPGRSVKSKERKGVDVVTDESELTKGFIIPGIGKRPIGERFIESICKRINWPKLIPVAVMNDTRAVEGGIVGTGFNLAFGRYNTEAGGLNPGIFTKIYKMIDKLSENSGRQLCEKQISGKYLEIGLNALIRRFLDESLCSSDIPQQKTEFISQILERGEECDELSDISDPYILKALHFASKRFTIRSTQLVGTLVGTGMRVFADDFPDDVVNFPIEGSVFWGIPGYDEYTTKYANQVLDSIGKKVIFEKIEHAGLKGAGAAALSMI